MRLPEHRKKIFRRKLYNNILNVLYHLTKDKLDTYRHACDRLIYVEIFRKSNKKR